METVTPGTLEVKKGIGDSGNVFYSVEFQPYDPAPFELRSRDFGSEEALHRFLQEFSISSEAISYLSSQLNNVGVGWILDLELEDSDLLQLGQKSASDIQQQK
jgi:hypothetical protein